MPEQSARINAAIRACLQRCYGPRPPLSCLAEYVAELRADPAWTDREIGEVERAVHRILKLIVDRPDNRDDGGHEENKLTNA
jgi:hypothetical protein